MSELQTEYKHIYFLLVGEKPKTKVWSCYNIAGDLLGIVEWYCPWRQYCFCSESPIVLSASCHDDIGNFIRQVMKIKR